MKCWILGSGSRGNAVLLECGDTRVLVDAGFPAPVISERLERIGVPAQSITACVITHEHHDHARGARSASRRWQWTVHATHGAMCATPSLSKATRLEPGIPLTIGSLELLPVSVPHDALEPVAIVATSTRTGVRMGIAYDLGHVTAGVRRAFQDLDVLVLEANHDEGMLRAGPYPPSVQHRIAGPRGHLGNGAAARLAQETAHKHMQHLVLAHLSEHCNDARVAMTTVANALATTRFTGTVHIAPQDQVVGPFTARVERTRRAQQLSLGL